MILDVIVAIILILAIIKGYQRGLIVGVFSLLAIIIGLAAAIKLSAVVAGYIGKAVKLSDQWLPIISFAVVFFIVLLLVRLGAKAIQRTVEIGMMGWINRLGGIVFYIAIYITILSIVLFYAEQMNLLQPETKQKSITYTYIHPLGPKAIDAIGSVIPIFKNMFDQLKDFFGGVSENISRH